MQKRQYVDESLKKKLQTLQVDKELVVLFATPLGKQDVK